MFTTPRDKSVFVCLISLLYLTSPIVEFNRLYSDFLRGAFPPDRDSIGVPIELFLIVWLAGIPLVLGFTVWAALRYLPKVSLLGFNRESFAWSAIWTLIFGYFTLDTLLVTLLNISGGYLFETIQGLLLTYLFLVIRATIVFQKGGA